ncbi:MAG: hypothetical protein ACK5MI_05355 [Mangrovibacterium sp.]
MENIIFILISLVFVFFAERKRRAKDGKSDSVFQKIFEDDSLPEDFWEKDRFEEERTKPVSPPFFDKVESKQSNITPEEVLPKAEKHRSKSRMKAAGDVSKELQVETFEPVLSNFDLKKAIVYAEIMKPKFKED